MFIRKLKHPNGKIYVQVVEKLSGKYVVRQSFGSAKDKQSLSILIKKVERCLENKTGMIAIDFSNNDALYTQMLESISSVERNGYDLLLEPIFNKIGFNKIKTDLFNELVIARVAFPHSKLKTTKFLYRYKNIDWNEDKLYRYLYPIHSNKNQIIENY